MKKIPLLLAFISGITLTGVISWKNNNSEKAKKTNSHIMGNPENRPIVAVRKIKLKPGVTNEAFEQFAIKAKNGDYCKLPGVKIYFGRGERGDEPNSYLYFLEFDSKVTRDFYVPAENDPSKASPDAKKLVDVFINKFLPELNKMADIKITGKGYTDYIILDQ